MCLLDKEKRIPIKNQDQNIILTCSFYFSIVDMDKIEPRMLWFSHKQKIKIAQIFNQFQLLMFNFLVFVCAVLRIGQQKFSLIFVFIRIESTF